MQKITAELAMIPKVDLEDALLYTALALKGFNIENRGEILNAIVEYMTWIMPSEARRLLCGDPLQ